MEESAGDAGTYPAFPGENFLLRGERESAVVARKKVKESVWNSFQLDFVQRFKHKKSAFYTCVCVCIFISMTNAEEKLR